MRGGQHQVLLLMHSLREKGHDCVLLARDGGPLAKAAAAADFAVYPAGPGQLWTRSRSADVVHTHDARAHTLAAVASRQRFVASRRVAFPVGRSITSVWKYRRASRFVTVSQFVARELRRAGVCREKIDVVYDAAPPVVGDGSWSAAHPAVALASEDPQKGRDIAAAAAQIAGIAVRFSDDLVNDLRRASMFVYITRSEGLGSAALVAMSMGVPVIASAVGGLSEVVESGESGLLVKNDPQEIAASMRRIVEEPALTERFIANGRRRIEAAFTPEHLVGGTLMSYERAFAS